MCLYVVGIVYFRRIIKLRYTYTGWAKKVGPDT